MHACLHTTVSLTCIFRSLCLCFKAEALLKHASQRIRLVQVGKELGGGHQGAVYELLDGKGKDSGQVLKVCFCKGMDLIKNALPHMSIDSPIHASTTLLGQVAHCLDL